MSRLFHDLGNGTSLQMVDSWNPNEYSIEEAIIYAVNPSEKNLKKGDRVLVDFAVFTAGMYSSRFKSAAPSRLIFSDNQNQDLMASSLLSGRLETGLAGEMIYYAFDGSAIDHQSEIFATIFASTNGDQILPTDELIFINPPTDEELDWHQRNGIFIPPVNRDTDNFFATVFASSNELIQPGDTVFCQGGTSARIKYGTQTLEYIRLSFLFGVIKQGTSSLKLF